MSETLEIRRYEPADHDVVVALHFLGIRQTGADPGPGPWDDDMSSPDSVAATYLAPGGEFLVGVVNGRVVAMGALRATDPHRFELKRMRVHPDFQRRGFGQALLYALEARAVELGARTVHLDTTTLQTPAIAMYRNNGYNEVGRATKARFELVLFEKELPLSSA